MKDTICIAGKNLIAVNGLDYILANHSDKQILFLPNSSDDGVDSWQPSFKRFAQSKNVRQTTLNELYEIPNLVFISLEYAELVVPSNFLSPELFNIHFSLLPKYKGMYTSTMPLLYAEKLSGVTLHKIDAGIDTGDIINSIEFNIEVTDTARDIYFKYLKYSFELFVGSIDSLLSRSYVAKPQSSIGSSYFSKKSINYRSIEIDFRKTAFEIHNQFRAYTFREFQMPELSGWQILKTEIMKNKSVSKPGLVVEESVGHFIVATIDYNIKLYKDYYPVLWEAAKEDDIKTFRGALKFIEDLEVRNNCGWNALIIAVFNGSVSIVDQLLQSGANPSSTDYEGTTALMYAFGYYEKTKDSRIFELLIKNKADYNAKDNSGKTLRDYMMAGKCEELFKYIKYS